MYYLAVYCKAIHYCGILIRLQVFFYWSEPFDDWIFAGAGGGAQG